VSTIIEPKVTIEQIEHPAYEFLKTLVPHGWIDLRALGDKKRQTFYWENPTGCTVWANVQCSKFGRDVYFGVAARINDRSGKAENCAEALAVWADIDFKMIGETAARARLASYPLKPSFVVNSGGGLHPYWLLNRPVNLTTSRARFEAALRKLAADVAGDPAACDIARILRVPGTLNYKPEYVRQYGKPLPVHIESWIPERKYDFAQFVPANFEEPVVRPATSGKTPRSGVGAIRRARRYLRACPKPIINAGSDHLTYRVGAKLIGTAGGDFGLTVEEALPLLCDWQPAFDPEWFRKKLENVRRYARGGRQ
jgi:hypothetical protein